MRGHRRRMVERIRQHRRESGVGRRDGRGTWTSLNVRIRSHRWALGGVLLIRG
ncbi:hypothetical protein [Streptomyces sp. NBC_00989]|uniref:hypothetical protein n=1 Tax=Streptomyces sp. NBC_00989 TaxID=2903705 RepID=UPI00386D7640|nr:hypothetical protein OG714_03110 [Streptomyces sp. NBC_00989]